MEPLTLRSNRGQRFTKMTELWCILFDRVAEVQRRESARTPSCACAADLCVNINLKDTTKAEVKEKKRESESCDCVHESHAPTVPTPFTNTATVHTQQEGSYLTIMTSCKMNKRLDL